MGARCCSSAKREEVSLVLPSSEGQHHSLLVQPGESHEGSCSYSIVYRPPHFNQRLTPGEARPRFWLGPSLPYSASPPLVSIAWTQNAPFPPPEPQCLPWGRPLELMQHHQEQQELEHTQQHGEELEDGKGGKLQNQEHDVEYQEGHRRKRKQRSRLLRLKLKSSGAVSKWYQNRSPCTYVDGSEKTVMANQLLNICAYPPFLRPFVDKVLRLRLVFSDPIIKQLVGEYSHLRHNSQEEQAEPMMETSHLVRNVHSLKVLFRHSPTLQGLPDITLIENHGGVKRLRRVRCRPMPVTWIDLDHRKPAVRVVGEQFELTLSPPSSTLTCDDFYDSNGERPRLLGRYERGLDTCPQRRLVFSVRLYSWFNQTAPTACDSELSDIVYDMSTPKLV